MTSLTINSDSLDATREIGRRLGAQLACGHVVALIGPLGSGKTTLVKAIADGAGVTDVRKVTSPTFVIVNEYEARRYPPATLRIYHVDTYRLAGSGDLEALGFDEMCATGATLIEWADRVADLLPPDVLSLTIEPIDANRRRFHCSAGGPTARQLLAALASGQPETTPPNRARPGRPGT